MGLFSGIKNIVKDPVGSITSNPIGTIGQVTGGLTGAGIFGSNIGGQVGTQIGGMFGLPTGSVGKMPFNFQFGMMPQRPKFESQLGPGGMIREELQLEDTLNRDYLDKMRGDALRDPGTASTWRSLMDDKLTGQAARAGAGAQAQTQNVLSNLSMRGGLRGGTAERIAQSGAQNALQAQQNVFGRGIDLDIQDEQMRQQQLAGLGQAELQAAQFGRAGQQFNIQNSLNELLQQRAEQINAYNEQMRAWGAERTAAATPSGGGGKK